MTRAQSSIGTRTERMACLEVRGGNRATEAAFSTQGLDLWLKCVPYENSVDLEPDSANDTGGGDVHFVSSCATGRITRLLLADLSGHGAAVDAAGRELKRLMGQFSNYIEQTRFIDAVNRRLAEVERDRDPTAGLFATAAFATFFAPTGELSLANAGHPPPLLYRASSNSWTLLDHEGRNAGDSARAPSGLPLGVLENTRYPEANVALQPGDLVLFYSDALIEARSQDGAELGIQGFAEIVQRVDPTRPDAMFSAILIEVNAFRCRKPGAGDDDVSFQDDLTLMLIRPNSKGPRPSISLGFAATLRLVHRRFLSMVRRDLVMPFPEWTRRNIVGAFISGANRSQRNKKREDSE